IEELGPEFLNVGAVRLEIGGMREVGIPMEQFRRVINEVASSGVGYCANYTKSANTFIVTHALQVVNYRLFLLDDSGRRIPMSSGQLRDYVRFPRNINAFVDNVGGITLDSPLFVGVRAPKTGIGEFMSYDEKARRAAPSVDSPPLFDVKG